MTKMNNEPTANTHYPYLLCNVSRGGEYRWRVWTEYWQGVWRVSMDKVLISMDNKYHGLHHGLCETFHRAVMDM